MCISENISPDEKKYFETVCEDKEFHISCDYGRPPAIQIQHAVWGRLRNNICPLMNAVQLGCNIDVSDPIKLRYFLNSNDEHISIDLIL